jgi:hypothetical protein
MKSIAFLCVFLVGCGSTNSLRDPCPYEPQFYTPLGIGVYVDEGAAPYTRRTDFAARIDTVAHVVGDYAGQDPAVLEGWVVVFRDPYPFDCAGSLSVGCAHKVGWIEITTSYLRPCVEQSSLVHEFLHAYGLWDHTDPRWTDWVSVADALNATEPTYTTENGEEAACWTAPALWYPGLESSPE